jgi:tRNA(fMet)-specific endonuclease VapC
LIPLLDTNAYVGLKRGHEAVARLVRGSGGLAISMVVVGELLFGFRNGTRFEQNAAELDDFLTAARVKLLPVTRTTADRFGRIASALRKTGKPLPPTISGLRPTRSRAAASCWPSTSTSKPYRD